MLKLRRHEGSFRTLRLGHHEIGLECLLALLRHLAALVVDLGRRHLPKVDELAFDFLLYRRDEQRAGSTRVRRPQRIKHGPVVVQTEAGEQRRMFLRACLVQGDALLEPKQPTQA
ncbi:hypothetical protein R52603_05779 [Paraburkholderia saeva]|nr:hypothetical protein R70241_05738 [Paraburkholderia saeva]CAG4929059.1 hypothetical protein R52603_05779 [Paraburkholderia saeva]